jgi:hypothetical protein
MDVRIAEVVLAARRICAHGEGFCAELWSYRVGEDSLGGFVLVVLRALSAWPT